MATNTVKKLNIQFPRHGEVFSGPKLTLAVLNYYDRPVHDQWVTVFVVYDSFEHHEPGRPKVFEMIERDFLEFIETAERKLCPIIRL